MPTISVTGSQNDTLSGFPAHQVNYTSTGIPGLMLAKTQVFTVINNTAYVVTYGAEQNQYDNTIQDVEKLIDSVKISPDNPAVKGKLKQMASNYSTVRGSLKQMPSVPTDFPNNDASVLKVDVFSAKKDTIDNWHIKGSVTNTGTNIIEFVNVVAHFYANNQAVGVTTCCYVEPHTIEPGHTSTFDSFVAAEDMVSDPDSFRLAFDWR